MKTRNWEIFTLAIFLAFCLTLYAGHSYTSQEPGMPFYPSSQTYDSWWDTGPSYNLWYTGQNYSSWGMPQYYDPWQMVKLEPSGLSTVQLLREMSPSLRYETFFSKSTDFYGYDLPYSTYESMKQSTTPNPYDNPYELLGRYARSPYESSTLEFLPASSRYNLYQFTTRMPEMHSQVFPGPGKSWLPLGGGFGGYGGYGGYGGFGGMLSTGGGLGSLGSVNY